MSSAGKLLLASPLLRDPNFVRTVVYLCAHDDHGALGVVLNRPNPVAVAEVMPRWADQAAEPASLFAGGPVDLDSAIGLGWITRSDPANGSIVYVEDPVAMLDLNSEPDTLAPHLGALRIYLGYAGWGAGQLESEIGEGAWHVAEATPADVFTVTPAKLWGNVLRRQRSSVATWSTYSDDPTLN